MNFLVDFQKAFDTVNHKILLAKLEHYGIRGNILKCFDSYLSNRKQYVFYNGVSSDVASFSCGGEFLDLHIYLILLIVRMASL